MVTLARIVCFIPLAIILCFLTVTTAAQSKDLKTIRDDKQTDGYVGVALVIGNSAYKYATPLNSPVNDANDIGKTLTNLGFKVLKVKTDATFEEMEAAIADFGRALESNKGVALFYYSGHGVQLDGKNFLIPVDVNIPLESFQPSRSIEVDIVLRTMANSTKSLKIVILDACRNNPFAKSWNKKGPVSDGLAAQSSPKGTLIAYATSPNESAADGTRRNSPYTEVLLAEIVKPNVKIGEMFDNVGEILDTKTDGRQTPWKSNSPTGKFCFAGCNTPPTVTLPANSSSSNSTASNPSNNEECTNCINMGPVVLKNSYYIIESIRYRLYASVVSAGNKEEIENEVDKLFERTDTHKAGINWYYMTAPKKSDGLLLVWRNTTEKNYGWAFIQRNAGDKWFYRTNGADWKLLTRDKEYIIEWEDNPVKIYLKAPDLDSNWKKEDFKYKFDW